MKPATVEVKRKRGRPRKVEAVLPHKNGKNGHRKGDFVPQYVYDLLAKQDDKIIKLDIGSAINAHPGFIVMDIQPLPGVHIVHDWDVYPWPLPDASISVILASHVVEHINPAQFGFIKWMNEAWRILKYDGQMVLTTPYAGSPGYWSDPTHVNPCTHLTWKYFDPIEGAQLWPLYKPKPWKIKMNDYDLSGACHVVLEKRYEDNRD